MDEWNLLCQDLRQVLYFLYIDESGDHDEYYDNFFRVSKTSKFFTLGGIIVDEENKHEFDQHFSEIKIKFFNDIILPNNFKLHYHDLRFKHRPYDTLSDLARYCLMDEVFKKIISTKCTLLSVTIDKKKHFAKYSVPANPRGYSLYIMLERFQYFLEENSQNGEVIFERYNSKMRKMVDRVHRWLRSIEGFPLLTNFENVNRRIRNGNPTTDPILQYADFFAYVPWIRSTTCYEATRRYDQLKHKYYHLDHAWPKRGNVEI